MMQQMLVGMGGGAGGDHVEVIFAHFNDSYTASNGTTSDSPTLTLTPDIQYLYVLGCAGGGGGGWAPQTDDARGGGGGAGAIRYLTGYQIPGPNLGSPIKVKVGAGGYANVHGGTTQILLNGATVLQMNNGSHGTTSGGAGGTVSVPGLTRLSNFPSNNEATGGAGGAGGQRGGSPGQHAPGGHICSGGGGGGAHVSNKPGGDGGGSPTNTNSYNIVQQRQSIASFANPYPISLNGTNGGSEMGGSGGGFQGTGGNKELALGGRGHGADGNTGSSGGAGAGIRVQSPNAPSAEYRGGGGGGVRSYITPPFSTDSLKGWGGGGFIIVIGSSYELVSGVDY